MFKRIVLKKIKSKPTVFGQELLGEFLGTVYYHRSDVWRLMILMNYGGIFLDNDVYVVNSLNKYRKFEMTLSFENEDDSMSAIGNQVLLAHKNARLLRAHFDFYRRDYNKISWFYNAGWFLIFLF
jgi:mannosyltransferase OCH1-like enzyme